MNALLRTTALSIGHGDRPLLEGIDLAVDGGELVALIGANGTGKSTLLRTLAGLHPMLSGDVEYGDEAAREMGLVERARRVSIVLTGRPRTGAMDVETLVGLGRHPWTGRFGAFSETDRRIVATAMERCDITALRSRVVGSLSDGECQQVMIARALAQAAPLMLLDEPTAHLDLANRVRIMRLLRDLARNGSHAVVLSTHDLQLALDLADRIVLIRRDRSHWQGTPAEARSSGALAAEFDDAHVRFDPAIGVFRAV